MLTFKTSNGSTLSIVDYRDIKKATPHSSRPGTVLTLRTPGNSVEREYVEDTPEEVAEKIREEETRCATPTADRP